MTPICPYCEQPSRRVTGHLVYPGWPELAQRVFYYCDNGHEAAWVGSHRSSGDPLGTPANSLLRGLRKECHRAFDHWWKSGKMSRSGAYRYLQNLMELPASECHIAMFDEATCRRMLSRLGNQSLDLLD